MWPQVLRSLWSGKGAGWRGLRIIVGTCCGLVVLLLMFENKLIFFPSCYPEGRWEVDKISPPDDQIFPLVEDCWLATTDHVRIHGWYCSPQVRSAGAVSPIDAQGILLFCHGNAGNITDRYEFIQMLVQLRVNLLIFDYRGYGKSEGSPSEEGVYKDARAAWDYLTETRGLSAGKIILFGESLGGAVAIDLARQVEPGGLIVQSSFTSIGDMASLLMPGVPRFLLRTTMDSLSKIPNVSCPKLFVHSKTDEVVPFSLGRRLFEAARYPKQFYEVQNAGHNDTHIAGGQAYLKVLGQFIHTNIGQVDQPQQEQGGYMGAASETKIVACPSCGAKNRIAAGNGPEGFVPVCGRCKTSLSGASPVPSATGPIVVSDANYREEVEDSTIPVLLDMWAPWCGPCRTVGPIVEQLASELSGRVKVAKLNVDENPATSGRFGVRSIPTLLILKDGKELDRIVGAQPKPAILAKLQAVLG
jgi:thioredoxin